MPKGCKENFLNDWSWNGFKEIIEMEELGAVDKVEAEIDPDALIEIYNFSGIRIAESLGKLKSGAYIVKQGAVTKKLVIK